MKEWNEGYEDLKAIPHSFAIEFNDKRGPWSMFCDQEEEKVRLILRNTQPGEPDLTHPRSNYWGCFIIQLDCRRIGYTVLLGYHCSLYTCFTSMFTVNDVS